MNQKYCDRKIELSQSESKVSFDGNDKLNKDKWDSKKCLLSASIPSLRIWSGCRCSESVFK